MALGGCEQLVLVSTILFAVTICYLQFVKIQENWPPHAPQSATSWTLQGYGGCDKLPTHYHYSRSIYYAALHHNDQAIGQRQRTDQNSAPHIIHRGTRTSRRFSTHRGNPLTRHSGFALQQRQPLKARHVREATKYCPLLSLPSAQCTTSESSSIPPHASTPPSSSQRDYSEQNGKARTLTFVLFREASERIL